MGRLKRKKDHDIPDPQPWNASPVFQGFYRWFNRPAISRMRLRERGLECQPCFATVAEDITNGRGQTIRRGTVVVCVIFSAMGDLLFREALVSDKRRKPGGEPVEYSGYSHRIYEEDSGHMLVGFRDRP